MQKLIEILHLAEAEAAPLGLTVVDARLSQQGKRRTLEITICRKGAHISLNDCEELSRKLDKALDEKQPPLLEGSYLLEVQSPGLDRQIKSEREFEIFKGEEVEVRLKETIAALGDHFRGILQEKTAERLNILSPQAVQINAKKNKKGKSAQAQVEVPKEISVEWNKVAHVRLHPPAPPPEPVSDEEAIAALD
ncbi:MAG: hypothetical protein K2X27_06815 [Candidatus Obscuribacterales bacterium]|nr:hypothetical protein [Candidatus Obscuribacterales bacterium]